MAWGDTESANLKGYGYGDGYGYGYGYGDGDGSGHSPPVTRNRETGT